jgi:phosphoglycolate phosphatase-like HAD superfamily hydrolase
MTATNPALDAAIRQARHLLFAFDGPIRKAEPLKPADSTTPTAPYIYEALAACQESGRSAVVITPKPLIDVPAYLDARPIHSGHSHSGILEATPADCLFITNSPADIEAAQAAGALTIFNS